MICIPILIVASLPYYAQQYWYYFPSHLGFEPQPWIMKSPDMLSVAIPPDAVKAYVTWSGDPTVRCNVTCKEGRMLFNMSWWGKPFDLGIEFKSLNRKLKH